MTRTQSAIHNVMRNNLLTIKCFQHCCLWQNTAKCRQAEQLVKLPNRRLTKYALKLSRKDLWVLAVAGLLTGHADLNRHLTLMQVRNDEICPLYEEEAETTLHLLGKCCALINQRLEILGSHYVEYEDLTCFIALETSLEACKGL